MKMKIYDGPLKEKIDKYYDVYAERLEVGEEKSIQCPNYKNWYEKYGNFDTRPSDVWVVSFAKAGTTWTQEMVWCIFNDLESEKSKESLMKRFPFFEWDSLLPEDTSSLPDYEEGDPSKPGETWKILHTMNNPRLMKSHLHFSLLPKTICTNKSKIIYVCRDPRDVCVSYFYHSVKLDGFTGQFDDFFDLFVNDVVFFAPFWKHVLDFWEKRNEENILFIRYEELQENLRNVIEKVSCFAGKELTEEYIQKMENHLSFASMSSNKAVNNETLFAVDDEKSQTIKFMRKGKVGDWKSHFNKDQIELFRNWTEENLKNTDFPFYKDYE